ncbi:hypothetical protein TNIN_436771 [Trichonephila inaurata madagascariensis]|uniref:Uncharacterized protein n=1 Tax=Trichonephila inaurata madagascariensis TaxID=2747483 RepID=A0A8X7C0G6_9ARAC|nr:hypothetical protein TNIN_436771 [Trichonephila inaurata madagascariensis]
MSSRELSPYQASRCGAEGRCPSLQPPKPHHSGKAIGGSPSRRRSPRLTRVTDRRTDSAFSRRSDSAGLDYLFSYPLSRSPFRNTDTIHFQLSFS